MGGSSLLLGGTVFACGFQGKPKGTPKSIEGGSAWGLRFSNSWGLRFSDSWGLRFSDSWGLRFSDSWGLRFLQHRYLDS